MSPVAGDGPAGNGRRWLLLGAGLSLLALEAEYDVAAAAWISSVFLLRYARLRPPWPGLLSIWGVTVGGAIVWLCLTATVASPTMVGSFLVLACLLALPFALDRILVPRLRPASLLLSTLVFPLARAGAELLFTVITGFGNYGSLAATQHANLALLQL
ncbi:MAG TPA: hypothetical protein VGP87_06735, partial [Gemmatimonadales bacterium]|nr:hypothetical protein [Gemmatimonadales bacterium]